MAPLTSLFNPLDSSSVLRLMPEIQPFRGWRYNLGQVGQLSDVVAPPYDVIDAALQAELYRKHPCNVIRLILNREELGDDAENNRYTRAAKFLRHWKNEEVLVEEANPALYVYHQEFEAAGQRYTRKGLMCRVRLERFGEGKIFPHEETLPGPKADRLQLMEATAANLSPIFGLYPDPAGEIQNRLEKAIAGKIPLQATDPGGVVHRLWPLTSHEILSNVSGLIGPKAVFIADGHHRYETALTYRDRRVQKHQPSVSPHPAAADYVLMMLVALSDPGLVILPTHRLVAALPGLTSPELVRLLGDDFETQPVGQGAEGCRAAWEWMQADGAQELLGFGTTADGGWLVARLLRSSAMDEAAPEHSEAWRALGVSILHRLVLEHLLAAAFAGKAPEIRYVHPWEEVQAATLAVNDARPPCHLACLVQPANIDHLQRIASHLERMPPKSTYFYPKLLSGLVINPLR